MALKANKKQMLRWFGLGAIVLVILILSGVLIWLKMPPRPIDMDFTAREGISESINAMPMKMEAMPMGAETFGKSAYQLSQSPEPTADRKVILNASLDMAVESAGRAVEAVSQIARNYGGFVQNSQIYKISEDKSSGFIQIKVPEDNFNAAIEAIENLDLIIERVSKNINSQDVTREFIDYEARLKVLQKTEEELLALLKRSGKLSEILDVQRELNNIRIQIEQVQGQLNYLASQVNYALISVSLSEETPEFLGIRWKPLVQIKLEIQNLLKGLRDFGNFLISVVFYHLPVLIVRLALVGLIIWILIKIYKRLKIKFSWQFEIDIRDINFWLKSLGIIAVLLLITLFIVLIFGSV